MDQFETFCQLHNQSTPLLIGNVWDVTSAKIFEQLGFKAIATSSAALARTMGYEDGEKIPFDLLATIVDRIKKSTSIPLSVDMEGGYSSTIPGIIANIDRLYELGIAGINIEDSVKGEKPFMRPKEAFGEILSAIREHCENKNRKIFINARTDAYVLKLPSALDETLDRIRTYEAAGATGIFVPFLQKREEIRAIAGSTTLPVNVFATPGLPSFDELCALGVRRISMGTAVHRSMLRSLEQSVRAIQVTGSFDSLYA